MDSATLLTHVDRLSNAVRQCGNDYIKLHGVKAQISDFLREFAGTKSSFFQFAEAAAGSADHLARTLSSILENFKAHVQAGLLGQVTPQRQAQLDVVSDFLDQAHMLLNAKGVHPAAPIVLVGATLEEFLRTWIESKSLSLGNRKPCLESYAQVLHAEELITKQDMKDISAWGGLRNHAAHGEWEEVTDKQRAAIMLDGVNLFMRKYGA